jgi:signal peptidase II
MHRLQEAGRKGLALTSVAAWLRLAVIVIAGSAADLWTKAWAQHALEFSPRYADAMGGPRPSLPLLDLIWQANHGAVFGIGQHKTVFFIVFTFAAIAMLLWIFAFSPRRSYFLQTFLALVIAGAAGNLYDRINFGYVRDFLRFDVTAGWAFWGGDEGHIWPYVFNIADVWITVGVMGLALLWFCGVPLFGASTKTKESTDAAETSPPGQGNSAAARKRHPKPGKKSNR